MEIHRDLKTVKHTSNAAISVGMFDGVHIGHQALINKVKTRAEAFNGLGTVITFVPHPQFVLNKNQATPIKLLSTIEEKIETLAQLGLQRLIIIPFTEAFSKISPEKFIEDVLVNAIGFRQIIVGHDHRFGKGKDGGLDLLENLALKHHYSVELADVVAVEGEVVSSTTLRQLIASGNLTKANKFLGRHYILTGTLGTERPDKRWPLNKICNINQHKLIPPPGIFTVRARINAQIYHGILLIRKNASASVSGQKSLEVYLPKFEQSQHGETIKIELIRRVEGELKDDAFESLKPYFNLVLEK